MNNIDKNKTSWVSLCDDPKKILFEVDTLLKGSIRNRNAILEQTSDSNIIDILADDTYEFNSFHNLCGLMKYVVPNKEGRRAWNTADNLLNIHTEKIKIDEELYNKINKINEKKLDRHEKLFIEKIKNSYNKMGLNRLKQKQQIQNVVEQIGLCEDKLFCTQLIKGDKINETLFELIKLRNTYAKLLDSDNYFTLISDVNVDELKLTLKKIVNNLVESKNDPKINNGITINNNLSLKQSIHVMLQVITSLFGLSFNLCNDVVAWSPDVVLYNIKQNDMLLG